MNEILGKNHMAWRFAITTALGAYGGFPDAPRWWKQLSQFKLFQFFTIWILIYQGDRTGDEYFWTTFIALLVFLIMRLTKDISLEKYLPKNDGKKF